MFQGLEPCTFSYNQTLQFSSIIIWETVLELWLDILSSRVILMIFSVRLSTLALSSHLSYDYCLSKVFNSFFN